MQTHSKVLLVVCEITSGVDEVNHVDSIILCMMYCMWACGWCTILMLFDGLHTNGGGCVEGDTTSQK